MVPYIAWNRGFGKISPFTTTPSDAEEWTGALAVTGYSEAQIVEPSPLPLN
jgi:hypothetical protein